MNEEVCNTVNKPVCNTVNEQVRISPNKRVDYFLGFDHQTTKQVCNTVYEEVCEAAQPTYGGGRGGHGGASGGYGAAKAPACRQVLVDLTYWRQKSTMTRLCYIASFPAGSPAGVQERA